MSSSYGALGQSAPGATTLTSSYTVPRERHATIRVIACNRGAATTIRVAISPNGESIANKHYIIYDLALAANDSTSTAPVTVGGTDVVRVYSASGDVSFTVTGIEQDN